MVELRYSGGPSNKFATASIGGAMSTEVIPDGNLNNLWDDVNRVEVINGRTEWRMFYIYNNDVNDFEKVKFINLVIPTDTEISYAGDNSVTPELLVTEDQTPTGLSFLNFDEWNDLEVPLGQLKIGEAIPIWIRRRVTVGSDTVRTISFVINGINDPLSPTQDFVTVMNSFDNDFITARSAQFLTDVDLVGEALLS